MMPLSFLSTCGPLVDDDAPKISPPIAVIIIAGTTPAVLGGGARTRRAGMTERWGRAAPSSVAGCVLALGSALGDHAERVRRHGAHVPRGPFWATAAMSSSVRRGTARTVSMETGIRRLVLPAHRDQTFKGQALDKARYHSWFFSGPFGLPCMVSRVSRVPEEAKASRSRPSTTRARWHGCHHRDSNPTPGPGAVACVPCTLPRAAAALDRDRVRLRFIVLEARFTPLQKSLLPAAASYSACTAKQVRRAVVPGHGRRRRGGLIIDVGGPAGARARRRR